MGRMKMDRKTSLASRSNKKLPTIESLRAITPLKFEFLPDAANKRV